MRSHIRSWAFPLLAIFCSVFFTSLLTKPTYADECLSFIFNHTEDEYANFDTSSKDNITNTVHSVSETVLLCATIDIEGRIVNLYSENTPNKDRRDAVLSGNVDTSITGLFEYLGLEYDQTIFHGDHIKLRIDAQKEGEKKKKKITKTFPVTIDETLWSDLSKQVQDYVMSEYKSFSASYKGNRSLNIPAIVYTYSSPKVIITPWAGPSNKKEQKHSNYEDRICRENAGSFGWILCPVITGLTSFMGGAYDSAVKPLLEIDIKIINRDSGTYKAWEVFRNFANVIFVILLLIVLFSQLTGIGIDNYGIKKILPQLIVSAVLINLSFIICQFAVDVSNIVGNGLNGLLSSIAGQVSGSANVNIATGMQKATAGVATLVLGGAAGTIAVFAVGWALILPVLLSILSAALAVLLMFVLLGIRQAAALLLVAISPLAFACYILPGTKKLFDKWLNMFKGVLIMYPLSGLLIGGGFLASSIISVSDSDNVFVRITGLMLMVMPYFLLPSLIKKTFSAIDSVAAAIASKGDSLRTGAVSGIRKSDLYNELRDKGIAGKPGGLRSRLAQTKVGKVTGLRRSMSRAVARVDAAEQEHSKARTILTARQYSGEGLEQLQGRWTRAFESNNESELDAITNVMVQRFGSAATNNISDQLSTYVDTAPYQKSLRTLQNTMNNNSVFANTMKEKNPSAYEMISSAGMRYDSSANSGAGGMVRANMGWFVQNQRTATSMADWVKTSTSELSRSANYMTTDMISGILDSTDPAIVAGLQSEPIKRQILEATLYNKQHGTTLPDAQASANYQAEVQTQQTMATHEADALRRGTSRIYTQFVNGMPVQSSSFVGYQAPPGFNTGNAAPVRDAHGDHIYTDITTGRKWNANTGKYVP